VIRRALLATLALLLAALLGPRLMRPIGNRLATPGDYVDRLTGFFDDALQRSEAPST
jgi:hypothetical protein